MITTVSISPKRQVELPKDFCNLKKTEAGTALRVTEVDEGLYVTPLPEPTKKELREVIATAGRSRAARLIRKRGWSSRLSPIIARASENSEERRRGWIKRDS